MANAYFYSNVAVQTTLSGSISSGATSLTVGAVTGFPGSFPYVLALDYGAATEELITVTNASGTILTVTRGFGGTSAQSHSSGAVVRHVYNATDATDFRTHEAATSDVHGVTGALVGATQTQTLTNKTLTAPTITNPTVTGGGSLAGTFTGTPTFSQSVVFSGAPTFSGAPLFSGSPNFTGAVTSTQSAAGNTVLGTLVTADTFDRFRILADGDMEWGPGNAARDVTLYRDAANVLKTDDAFTAVGAITAVPTSTSVDGLVGNLPTSTTADILSLKVNSSALAAVDSTGAFRLYQNNTASTYTPTWGNTGGATFSVNTGSYFRVGKMVFINIYAAASGAGSGTSSDVTVTLPTNPSRSVRQMIPFTGENIGVSGTEPSTVRTGDIISFTGGSGAVVDRIRLDAGNGSGNLKGADIKSNSLIAIQGWYLEA